MVGLYIFGGLIAVGIVALIVFKVRWGRAEDRRWEGKIEKEAETKKGEH